MTRAVHFKCERSEGGGFKGLRYDKATATWRSGRWDLSEQDAQALVGGWLYLHPDKASRSEFGGIVLRYEVEIVDDVAHQRRIVFHVRKADAGTGQRWRGKSHSMAHASGLVDAGLPHEIPANSGDHD